MLNTPEVTCPCGFSAQQSISITRRASTCVQLVAPGTTNKPKKKNPTTCRSVCPHTCQHSADWGKVVLSKPWLAVIIRLSRLQTWKKKNQAEWSLNLTELSSFPLSLIQKAPHTALRRLPRDAIWPAACAAAGYRAQSNEEVTLHRREESNGDWSTAHGDVPCQRLSETVIQTVSLAPSAWQKCPPPTYSCGGGGGWVCQTRGGRSCRR